MALADSGRDGPLHLLILHQDEELLNRALHFEFVPGDPILEEHVRKDEGDGGNSKLY